MERGDIIRNKDTGELGIFLGGMYGRGWAFLGDGLTMFIATDDWETVPFHPNAAIVANFVELVNGFEARHLKAGERR